MPTISDFDRYDLTASQLVKMTAAQEGVKLVHNLTDRGIIPFRKNGRARLFSFSSLLTLDTMIRARGAGLPLNEGAKLAEIVLDRAKERIRNHFVSLDDALNFNWLVYAFDRESDPPYLVHGFAGPDDKVSSLQVTLVSGWHADVVSMLPIDRIIWECSDSYRRHCAGNTND